MIRDSFEDLGTGNCQVTIDTIGGPTYTTWYVIWEAITAVSAACVRAEGCIGLINRLGELDAHLLAIREF